jgi:hypothetical protein
MFYQGTTDNMVLMICLNPVTDCDDSVKRRLFSTDADLHSELSKQSFKDILLTNATMEDGEDKVVKYFKVKKQWEKLLDHGFKRYYELLFLVKSSSSVDHV